VPTVGRVRYIEALPRSSAGSGEGPARDRGTLLLLHAFPLNAAMWEAQLAMADRGWRVIAPEFARGTLDDFAGDLVDLLDALHVHEAVIAGQSMGGYAAFALLRLAPTYIQGLVLADTRPQADAPEALEGRRRLRDLAARGGAAAVADEMIPKLLGETTRRTRSEVVDRVRSLILASSSEAIGAAIRAMMTRPDSTPLLRTIHVPTLIVVGEEDTITPPPLSIEMQRAIPGSLLVTIAGAGHLSSLEQPAAFNEALAAFLDHRL
jgi:3-oxoadipate enol-lactonase